MKKRLLAGLAAALLLLGTAGCGSNTPAYGTVSGIVSGYDGAGVYEARVQAKEGETGPVIKETLTDLKGRFELVNLPAGKQIDLAVTKAGYTSGMYSAIVLTKGEYRILGSPIELIPNDGTVIIEGVITLE